MNIIEVIVFTKKTGKSPFYEWENKLDFKVRMIVANRLDRIHLGNFGDCKVIKGGGGIKEIRIDFGSGYRIYFGMHKSTIVILLVAGDKKSQLKDIETARQYWIECKEELL